MTQPRRKPAPPPGPSPDERAPADRRNDTRRDAAEAPAAGEGTREADVADERLADWLVQLVAERARDDIDPDDPAQARYFDWLAREARAEQSPAERAETVRLADAFARDLLRRIEEREADATESPAAGAGARDAASGLAATRTMRCVATLPELRPPRGGAIGPDAVQEASRAGYAPRFALGVAAGVGRELWDEPADAWLRVPDDIAPGQHLALTVRGESMLPLLHDGDTVLVRLGGDVMVGDVIVARRPEDGYVVKRVADVSRERLVLASDNAAWADIAIPHDARLVVGAVVLRWCAHAARA